MARAQQIHVKRAYDDPGSGDGARVLVDRLWPRGLSKEAARLDDWCKEVAPTSDLRTWYGHDVEKFDEFCTRYAAELEDEEHQDALQRIRGLGDVITLVTATKDVEHSQVPMIVEALSS